MRRHACDGRTDEGKVENSVVFCWTSNRKRNPDHRHQLLINNDNSNNNNKWIVLTGPCWHTDSSISAVVSDICIFIGCPVDSIRLATSTVSLGGFFFAYLFLGGLSFAYLSLGGLFFACFSLGGLFLHVCPWVVYFCIFVPGWSIFAYLSLGGLFFAYLSLGRL